MTRTEPSQSAVRLMSQAGPGPGFGFLDLAHAMVVGAAELHVHRLAAVAVADLDGPPRGRLPIGRPHCIETTKAANKS